MKWEEPKIHVTIGGRGAGVGGKGLAGWPGGGGDRGAKGGPINGFKGIPRGLEGGDGKGEVLEEPVWGDLAFPEIPVK